MRVISWAALVLAGLAALPASAKVYSCRSDRGAEHVVEVKGERFAIASGSGVRVLCGGPAQRGDCERGKGSRSWADGAEGERIRFGGRKPELQIYDPATDTTAYFACTCANSKARARIKAGL